MDREIRDTLHTTARPVVRRSLFRGALLAALFGGHNLLSAEPAEARKHRKKKKSCRGGCQDGEACKAPARQLPECFAGEEAQWCEPAPGNPLRCCPADRIYAICPLDDETAQGECGASESETPSVCCPEAKLCGNRCCEKPFQCVDANTSTCTSQPPIYARLKRPR